jgi:hypothetical protein
MGRDLVKEGWSTLVQVCRRRDFVHLCFRQYNYEAAVGPNHCIAKNFLAGEMAGTYRAAWLVHEWSGSPADRTDANSGFAVPPGGVDGCTVAQRHPTMNGCSSRHRCIPDAMVQLHTGHLVVPIQCTMTASYQSHAIPLPLAVGLPSIARQSPWNKLGWLPRAAHGHCQEQQPLADRTQRAQRQEERLTPGTRPPYARCHNVQNWA